MKYISPEVEMLELEVADIILTSEEVETEPDYFG